MFAGLLSLTPTLFALGAGLPAGSSGPSLSTPSETVFAWADVDADGLEDAATIDAAGTLRLLVNDGDGSLRDVSAAAGLAGVDAASLALWGDFNADGSPDLLVGTESGPSRLFANRSGVFMDVSAVMGLDHSGVDRSARWLDYDRDGVLDLHVISSVGNYLYHGLPGEAGVTASFERIDLPAVADTPAASLESILLSSGGAVASPNASTGSGSGSGTGSTASTSVSSAPTNPAPVGGLQSQLGTPPLPVGSTQLINVACPPSLEDQAGGDCLQASSVPQLGDLYPLSEQWYVDAVTGNVGFGTTSPDEMLQIGEYFTNDEDAYVELRTIGGASPSLKQGVKMRSSNPFFGFDIEHDDDLKGLNIKRYDADFGAFAGETSIYIDRQNGCVGFGTTDTDPEFRTITDGRAQFDLSGGTGVGSVAVATPGGEAGLTATSFGGIRWDILFEDSVMTMGGGTTAGERTHMTQDGNTGFGTKSPSARIDVEGKVQIDGDANGVPDGGITTRRSTGEIAGLISGYAGGYQIGLVDQAQTSVLGGLFLDDATQDTTLFATVKNFRVDNPDDPSTDLVYACVEGPEAAMYVRGSAELVDGVAIVELPRHFEQMAVAAGMTVQITPNSAASLGLAVTSKTPGEFRVQELASGRGNYAFDWEVKAVRRGFEDYEVVRPKMLLNANVER